MTIRYILIEYKFKDNIYEKAYFYSPALHSLLNYSAWYCTNDFFGTVQELHENCKSRNIIMSITHLNELIVLKGIAIFTGQIKLEKC